MIGSDLDMYYEETDTPTGVRTSSLVEELGQIDYIFSDKTGTLTRNVMEFKSCSIGGRCYIEEIPEDGHAQVIDGIEIGYHTFDQLHADLKNTSTQQSAIINEFLTLLSTCHTVIPEVTEEKLTIKLPLLMKEHLYKVPLIWVINSPFVDQKGSPLKIL